jgi:hypothetical protein
MPMHPLCTFHVLATCPLRAYSDVYVPSTMCAYHHVCLLPHQGSRWTAPRSAASPRSRGSSRAR